MLGHLSFGVADLARTTLFYDAVLGPLGYARVFTASYAVGYSADHYAAFVLDPDGYKLEAKHPPPAIE